MSSSSIIFVDGHSIPNVNQVEFPQSFMAMLFESGHSAANAPQEQVLRRYELCEDMAGMLAELLA